MHKGGTMKIRDNRGMSLIEILVASAILAIAMPMITSILTNSIVDYVSGVKYTSQQDQINDISQILRNDHQKCSEIIVSRTASTPPLMLDSVKFKYDNLNLVTGTPFDANESPLDKEWRFVDNPSGVDEDEDGLEVKSIETSNTGVITTTTAMVLNNINVRPIGTPSSTLPKSGLYYSLVYHETINPAPEKDIWKIWMEIWFLDINTEFFKGRNFTEPVRIFFDTSNKKFTGVGL